MIFFTCHLFMSYLDKIFSLQKTRRKPNPEDWTCNNCNYFNYFWRNNCHKCPARKPNPKPNDSGGYDRGGYDRDGSDHFGSDRGGSDRGASDRGGSVRGGYDRGGYDRGGYRRPDFGGYDRRFDGYDRRDDRHRSRSPQVVKNYYL